jgi:hypothetical protein
MSRIEPPDPGTAKFLNALNDFMENPPRDLPDGTADGLKQIANSLKGYGSEQTSPGERELAQAMGATDGTGVAYSQAAKQQDAPSPGQREYEKAIKDAKASFRAETTD